AQKRKDPVISSFLQESLAQCSEKTQLVIARDTQVPIDPLEASAFVKQLFSDKATEPEIAAVSKVFASMTGVQFLVSIDHDIYCTLKGYFGQPLGEQSRKIPALVVTAIESMGLDLEPLQKSEPQLQDKSFSLTAR